MREKACVFVDGENLRHSLVDVFSDDGIFKPRDYLPATTEWAKFFDWVVLIATAGTHHRLRTYWFVVQEKSVDVRLACDMLMLRDIYDTAIIVSGDQDYVPAAQVLKDAGKTVINVSFERRNGDLLPGGARRLNIATDASIRIPYVRLREFMGLDSPRAALKDDSTLVATEAVS
jgi:hypothetical protein